jgi:hypothetical protein
MEAINADVLSDYSLIAKADEAKIILSFVTDTLDLSLNSWIVLSILSYINGSNTA